MSAHVEWLVCTSCGMPAEEIENGENWQLGQPATVKVCGDEVYVTPHRPLCRTLGVELERRQLPRRSREA